MSKRFKLIVYTWSIKSYAEAIIEVIDKRKVIVDILARKDLVLKEG